MKLHKYAFGLVVAATAAGMVSCDDDFDRPPVIVPEATIEVNTAITEFKEMFWSVTSDNSFMTIPVNQNGDSIILGGRIISSDEDGNVYQQIFLRDESGALNIRVHGYDLYESYQYGQELRINVTGLLVGSYGGVMQIGTPYNGTIGGMEPADLSARAQLNGLPEPSKVEAYTVTISELNSWVGNTPKLQEWQNQLVKIENVTFEGGGVQQWCDAPGQTGSTNRTIKDAEGNTIIARTSNKSTFSSDILPAGTGTVVAILGYFNGTWQLTFMDPESGCLDFDGTPSTPDTPADNIFSESFKDGIGQFTIDNVNLPSEMSEIWKHDSKYGYMIATGYSSTTKENYDTDSWLVSPVIDLAGQTSAYISFDQAVNFFSDINTAKTQATINIREEGATQWTTLTIPAYPASMSWDIVGSGDINISAFAGKKVQIGFHYTSTAAKAGTWEVKNFVVKPTGTDTPVTPPDEPTGDVVFSETFGSSQGAFTIENVTVPAEISDIWKFSSSYGMVATGYAADANYDSDSWLISPVIDLSALTSAKLNFDQALNFFADLETAKTQATVNIREEGASAWTTLTIPTYPSALGWSFVATGDIDLSAFCGKKVQIGFHYTSTAAKAGTWELKNVTVKK